eukprot:TRINITY_DN6342_c0_g1_i1.p1 TRINITY_DN6342_c0_g1~~TRINITY_DN6342_c0_g1_i1.p1  ORF type:complete len:447 (+),score=133.82 TRINITY_DN6342_c0_g1_i1:25-1365(+)
MGITTIIHLLSDEQLKILKELDDEKIREFIRESNQNRINFSLSYSTQYNFEDLEYNEYMLKQISKSKKLVFDFDKIRVRNNKDGKTYLGLNAKEIRQMESFEIVKALEKEGVEITFKRDHRKMANLLINRVMVHKATEEELDKLAKSKIVEILEQEKVKYDKKKTAKELLLLLKKHVADFREKRDQKKENENEKENKKEKRKNEEVYMDDCDDDKEDQEKGSGSSKKRNVGDVVVENKAEDFINKLNTNVLKLIFLECPNDLLHLRLVSKRWNNILKDEDVWKVSFLKVFPKPSEICLKKYISENNWRKIFTRQLVFEEYLNGACVIYLDKAAEAVSWLISGVDEFTKKSNKLSYLTHGYSNVGEDVAYGSARGLDSKKVKMWAEELEKLNDEEIYKKWKEPYPEILGGLLPKDDDRDYVFYHYLGLKRFVIQAAKKGMALFYHYS